MRELMARQHGLAGGLLDEQLRRTANYPTTTKDGES